MANPIQDAIDTLEEGKKAIETAKANFDSALAGVDDAIRTRCTSAFEDAAVSATAAVDTEINGLQEALNAMEGN